MTTIQPPSNSTNQDAIIIRALSSITPQQAATIKQAVQASSPAWEVMTADDYDGYLSILLQPSVSTDQQTSFFISGTARCLELSEANGDDLTTVATFSSAEALAMRLSQFIVSE